MTVTPTPTPQSQKNLKRPRESSTVSHEPAGRPVERRQGPVQLLKLFEAESGASPEDGGSNPKDGGDNHYEDNDSLYTPN